VFFIFSVISHSALYLVQQLHQLQGISWKSKTVTFMNEEDFAGSGNSAINSNDGSHVAEENVHNISDRFSVSADMW
jgi:hypothetical protein